MSKYRMPRLVAAGLGILFAADTAAADNSNEP